MLSTVKSIKLLGAEPVIITIETEITQGIGIHLVGGVADASVKEILLRTITALQSQGYHIPGKKITINLAPSDLYKSGTGYDLAIALGIIDASKQRELPNLDQWLVLGELGLDATVREVTGAVQTILATREQKLKGCIIPQANIEEFMELFHDDVPVYAAGSLEDAIAIIENPNKSITAWERYCMQGNNPTKSNSIKNTNPWDSLKGQDGAKRALEIAAAGAHPLLLIGAPGSGKQTMAKALQQLLPPMTKEEALDVAKIYSAAGRWLNIKQRPIREPHISCSKAAMLGGGNGDGIQPGEVSLAHHGILFLNDANEMPKTLQEALRGPLEDKKIVISRLRGKVTYPADFQLVAAMNPCPCGYYGEGSRCACTPKQRKLYLDPFNVPLSEYMTMMTWVHPLSEKQIFNAPVGESVATVAERVKKARQTQTIRYKGTNYRTNEDVTTKDADKYFIITDELKDLVEKLLTRLGVSVRSYLPILKIARTLADLSGEKEIQARHLSEAIGYRFMDRIEKEENINKEIGQAV